MGKGRGARILACLFIVAIAGSCEDFDRGPDLVVEVYPPQGVEPVEISDPLTACAGNCSVTTAELCIDDVDCPAGETCVFSDDPFTLQPTTGNPAFCCCRVVGRVLNRSNVPIHALLKFSACEDGEPFAVGTAVDFLATVVPGEDRPFSATGLLRPCDDVERIKLVEVDLNGVVFP